MTPPSRKAFRILGATLLVYGLLVGTHEGEFWPFSIYPMFSQAGQPWTRALVREVPPDVPEAVRWQPTDMAGLPGAPLPLVPNGLWQNDLANYVSKTKTWDRDKIRGIRTMFGSDALREKTLLVMKMQGRLTEGLDSVVVVATPYILLTPDTVRFNPNLDLDVRP